MRCRCSVARRRAAREAIGALRGKASNVVRPIDTPCRWACSLSDGSPSSSCLTGDQSSAMHFHAPRGRAEWSPLDGSLAAKGRWSYQKMRTSLVKQLRPGMILEEASTREHGAPQSVLSAEIRRLLTKNCDCASHRPRAAEQRAGVCQDEDAPALRAAAKADACMADDCFSARSEEESCTLLFHAALSG